MLGQEKVLKLVLLAFF
ncbi:hypothetical protein F383_39216 [Gossypium arboreum]|uniref:Uncharacterized protein n=1 Tax=Gossypium arboreum TaxID=29729 RepID=A0A0B0MKB9_GOSAR|nr:hypothetical protein F383_39216 [Gossypium arboreum]